MGKINREWHEAHRMPKNANDRLRAEWHYEHAKACGCRELTPSIVALLERHGYPAPKAVESR